jgi:hypothetical protein
LLATKISSEQRDRKIVSPDLYYGDGRCLVHIFQGVTDLFSKAEVPLVHQVIPMLETLEHQLTAVREAADLPNIIRTIGDRKVLC